MGKRKIFFSIFLGTIICLGSTCDGVHIDDDIQEEDSGIIIDDENLNDDFDDNLEDEEINEDVSLYDTLYFSNKVRVLSLNMLLFPEEILYVDGETITIPADTIILPDNAKLISIDPIIVVVEREEELDVEEDPEPEKTLREKLIETFRSQIGVRQIGNNTGPEIDMYLASIGYEPGYAWCGAFAAWGYLEHGIQIPNAAIWTPAWFPNSKIIPNEDAQMGDVGGIHFASLGRIAHIVVFDEDWSDAGNLIITVEGNTNDTGDRTGDGVYRKRRSKNQIRHSANWIDG